VGTNSRLWIMVDRSQLQKVNHGVKKNVRKQHYIRETIFAVIERHESVSLQPNPRSFPFVILNF
jgi:hypothetical protein